MRWLKSIGAERFYVLRIDMSDADVLLTSAMLFRKQNEQIDLDQKLARMPLKDILEQIPGHSNVVVVFSGDQVLTRYSSGESKNLFEEIEEDDFYIQKTESDSGWTIHSACRKSAVDPVCDLITIRKLFLLHMAYDPAVIPEISDHLNNTAISSRHLNFQFGDGHLLLIQEEQAKNSMNNTEAEINLQGMSLLPEGVSMLAGLLHYLKEGTLRIDRFQEYIEQSRYFRRFRRILAGVLVGLFVVLLANFLLFSSINERLDQLKISGESHTEQIHEIENLKSQIEEYSILSLNRVSAPGRSYSYYLEELAQHRPSGVWFNQLVVDPLVGKQENGKSIETNRSQINLTGETRDPVSLNNFINALKDLPWVNDIELKNYALSQGSSYALFELTIRKTNEF